MFALLVAHVAAGLAIVAGGRRLGRRSFGVAALVPLAGVVWAMFQWEPVVAHHETLVESRSWVAALDLRLDLRLDGFALVMALLVVGIGVLVQLYARHYFGRDRGELHRLAGMLLVFTGAMLGVVTAANLLTLYVAWELTSVTSYLLIGWSDTDARARASALQALLTTGIGGLAMLGGFVLLGQAAGTYDLAELVANPPTGATVEVALVLVLLGAFTKSGQFPFSAWLPGAMVAPTPISAFLHSATMVKAGVYLIARLAPAFASTSTLWRPIVVSVGVVTMLLAGWRALREYDLKAILAYGTISQLGFMVVLFGVGVPAATEAGVVVLVAHALFKACLFMVAGVIDHRAHTRDIRALGDYGPGWAAPRAVAMVAGASMAGVPLLFGFVGKEAAFEALAHAPFSGHGVALGALVAGSVLTVAYTARLLLGAFTPWTGDLGVDAPPVVDAAPAPAPEFWLPAAVLAVPTVVLGVAPALASGVVGSAAHSLDERVEHAHLALWHGWSLPLLLSGIAIAGGVALTVRRADVARAHAAIPRPVDGQRAYLAALRGLNRVADRVTGIVQPGSLPIYLGVTLVVAAAVPLVALVGIDLPDLPDLVAGPGQLAAAALLIGGGIAATVVRERIAAVLCLGAVGYGMALVFILEGAPDLALTQVCIDTLGAVVFVLVLRRLPNRFGDRPTRIGRNARIAVSALVGVFVFVFIVLAVGVRTTEPIAGEFMRRSLDEGGGRNVVNVIIVDFRGWDTMGEITVLATAALGVYGLVRLARQESRELRSFAPLRGLRRSGASVAEHDGGEAP